MCNLYSVTKGQQAIRELANAMRDTTGNLPSMPGVFPDYAAPIVRTGADGVRELTKARWGMPSPVFALQGRKVDKGVTNVRNTASPHWRRWLTPGSRCVVPFTSFSENERTPEGVIRPVWFALDGTRPLAFFAGIWTGWTCTRKVAEGEIACELFAFLTTDANAEVGAVHPKAMPVILTNAEEVETWLTAPWIEAGRLQRPLPDGALTVVARGEKKDAPLSSSACCDRRWPQLGARHRRGGLSRTVARPVRAGDSRFLVRVRCWPWRVLDDRFDTSVIEVADCDLKRSLNG